MRFDGLAGGRNGGGEVYVSAAQTEICGGNPENRSEMEAQRSFWLVGATSDDPPANAACVGVAWAKADGVAARH